MTLGVTPRQADLFRSTAALVRGPGGAGLDLRDLAPGVLRPVPR